MSINESQGKPHMMETLTYRQALRQSMQQALVSNPNSLIYGLGVTDHTGIFGTTSGLEQEFGRDRVFNTPLAEESMTGFGLGASLAGMYPIHIHIRNDFLLLACNQLVNSLAKYKSMYGGLFEAPMLIRAVIGRSWGQGGQHSQSLQSLFAHIPGLTVIMPSSSQSILETYNYVVNHYKSPVISLEHRLLYDYSFHVESKSIKNPLTSRLVRAGKDVTIIATSSMVTDAQRAAEFAKEQGVETEIIDLHCVTHPDENMIFESVKKTGRLIVTDTSWAAFGVCAEISRIINERDPRILKEAVINISMAKTTCPTSHALEKYFYPDMSTIVKAIYDLNFGKNHQKELPSEELKSKLYREFKGPF
jgi:pyruvate/2-oxoglutarate/acetoin dehydrogenase E1 component